MAVIHLSPLVVDIRNSIADVVFSKWRGINYTRSRVIPANPKTGPQMAIRNALARLVALWKGSDSWFRYTWSQYAVGKSKSGYNIWIGSNVVLERDEGLLDLMPISEIPEMISVSCAPGAGSKQIEVTYSPSPLPVGQYLHFYFREMGSKVWYIADPFAEGEESPQTLTLPLADTLYQYYIPRSDLDDKSNRKLSNEKSGTVTTTA